MKEQARLERSAAPVSHAQAHEGSIDAGCDAAQRFRATFEVIAGSKGGVELLRRGIRDLAVSGRLVVFPGIADASSQHAAVSDDPFGIPPDWRWSPLGDLIESTDYGTSQKAHEEPQGVPVLRMGNIQNGKLEVSSLKYVPASTEKLADLTLQAGDLLFNRTNSYELVGKMGVFREEGHYTFASYLIRVRVNPRAVDPDFLNVYFGSGVCRRTQIEPNITRQTNQANFNGSKLKSVMVPVPPLVEQKQIVAKVDRLMALCDELDAQQTKKREIGTRLTKSALDALATADGPDAFDTAWNRVVDNFDILIDRPEKVTELRRCVVSLALTGVLVRREDSEGTANELLATLGQPSTAPVAASDKLRRGLPSHWCWAPLAALITDGPRNGYSPKGVEHETAVKSLTLTATTSGRFDGRYFKYIDEAIPADSELWLRDGDLLVQRGNTIEYVGIAAVYRGPPHTFIYPDLMMKLRISDHMDLDFVHMAVNGPAARAFKMSRASGTSGSMPKINQATLLAIPIPVCPFDEQQRIMAKMATLMSLCDDLEARLRRSEELAAKLVEAVVQELVV